MGLTQPARAVRQVLPPSVLALMAALVAVAVPVDVAVLHLRLSVVTGTEQRLGLLLVAIVAFALAEAMVMHVELGRNTHSMSLAELVLVVALFFMPASALPLARLLGGGAALVLVRKQRGIKVAFNASIWLADTAAATLAFRTLGGSLHAGTERLMVPAIAASVVASVVDSIAVNLVISVTSGEIRCRAALRFLASCVANGVLCALLGAVCVGALAWTPWLLLPILLLVSAVMYGFHRFGAMRTQHSGIKVLYEFTSDLARTSHGRAVVNTVLERVVTLLRAERAALWLVSDEMDVQLTELRIPDRPTTRTVGAAETPGLVRRAMRADGPMLVTDRRDPDDADFLDQTGARNALLAPVTTPQGLRGVLVVCDRQGEVATFTADDGRLLQTLANHAGTAVANSRLVYRLNHDSTHDSLTGLANRAHFQDRLGLALGLPGTTAVLLMDLDRFKEVNDTLGHHHGDLLLQQLADRLRDELRSQDLLARLGGDEFALLIKGMTSTEAVQTARRLRAALAVPMRINGVDMEITASVGISLTDHPAIEGDAGQAPAPQRRTTDHVATATAMLQRADVAMYTAKHTGTGVEFYREALDDHSPRRLALASSLRAAIRDGQLTVRYQPQASLVDGSVVAAEALVRWEHPTYGEVEPEEFIGIAEQTGQIRELTRAVLDQALAACARWTREGLAMSVSVNLSVRNLLEADLVHSVSYLLAKHRVPSRLVTLEITESHLMADAGRTRQTLERLAALGVRLSVDDFGTGYSSLVYLKDLPVAEVKIDKGFIRELAECSSDAAIVEAILQLAHTLDLRVVAEGVEQASSEARLRELGCDLVQGYHLAPPMRYLEFTRWAQDRHVETVRPVLRSVPTPRPTEPRSLDLALDLDLEPKHDATAL